MRHLSTTGGFYDTSGARAAIYTRVSTEQQDDAIQTSELEQFCKASKWVIEMYTDVASGKERARRPALERLLKDARMKRIDVVVVWKLDRFGRSLREILENIETLNQAGVRFMVPQQGLDTDKDSAMGRFFISILGAVAELERSFIIDRTQAGYKAYRKAYDAGGSSLKRFIEARGGRHSKSGKDLPVGRPAKVFKRDKARKLRAAGKSWAEIAKECGVSIGAVRKELAKTSK